MKKPIAFISHIHEDAAIAARLESVLREALLGGVDFFNSSNRQSIRAGDPWRDLVIEKLRECVAVLVVATPESVGRPWINFESGGAWVHGRAVIPCCVAGMTPESLPVPLSHLHALNIGAADDLRQLTRELAAFAELAAPTHINYEDIAAELNAIGTRTLVNVASAEFISWIGKAQLQPSRFAGNAECGVAHAEYIEPVDQETVEYALPHEYRKNITAGSSIRFSARIATPDYNVLSHCFASNSSADTLVDGASNTAYRMRFTCMGVLREMASRQPIDRDTVWEDHASFFVDEIEPVVGTVS